MRFESPVRKAVQTISDDKIIESSGLPAASNFKKNIDGCRANLFTLKNQNNFQVAITNYGARIVGILVNNNEGTPVNVVLGYDDLKPWQKPGEPYLEVVAGGQSNLHSSVWDAIQISPQVLELSYSSIDDEEGYPCIMKVKVIYEITNDNSLKVEYKATTDRLTIIDMANHTCFNLNGKGSGTILNHQLQIRADNFITVDQRQIPTGTITGVKGSPFDFRKGGTIGSRINDHHEQLKNGNGYDHIFVLNRHSVRTPVARVRGDKSGIVMEICTNQPRLQFYTGNFLAEQESNVSDEPAYGYRSAFYLEPRSFPDSTNDPAFRATILKAGDICYTVTRYKFFNA